MPKKSAKKNPNDVSGLITQTEAATLRGVSRAAIRTLIQRGRLNAVEVFGRKMVYRSEVLAFEAQKPGRKSPEGSEE
jgi:excisionase family DNA binding protein